MVLQPAATSWRACVHDRDSFGLLCSQQIRPTTRSKRVRTRRWRTLVANLSTPDEERGMCCSLACRHFDRENERAVANPSTRLHSLHGNRQNTRVGLSELSYGTTPLAFVQSPVPYNTVCVTTWGGNSPIAPPEPIPTNGHSESLVPNKNVEKDVRKTRRGRFGNCGADLAAMDA